MAKIITNEQELREAIKGGVQNAVKNMMDKVLAENRNKIDQTVYSGFSPSQYDRTFEFQEAWKVEEVDLGDLGGASFEPAPENLSVNGAEGQHASYETGASFAEELPDAIYQGYQGFLRQGIPARNAFKKLDHWFTENKIRSMFKSGLTQSGFKVVQVGGASKSEVGEL